MDTIKNFLANDILTDYDTSYLKNVDVYRIYPVEDERTIKLRITSKSNSSIHPKKKLSKMILKIQTLNQTSKIKAELSFTNKYFADAIDVYRLNATSLKMILARLPNRYVDDLSEFISGQYIVLVYQYYDNLYHLDANMHLYHRINQIVQSENQKFQIFYKSMFLHLLIL